jgi:hypothetical protein
MLRYKIGIYKGAYYAIFSLPITSSLLGPNIPVSTLHLL